MTYIFLILNIVLIIAFVSLLIKYKKLKRTFRNHKKVLRTIGKTINSARYGNLYEKVEDPALSVLPNFSESVNRLIETIADREGMIQEYQEELSKEIETQKEIEKIKEDFVATLTHDLKVPIIAETNMLNFLMENRFDELTNKQKEAVSHLMNSNKELVELVEILLETYKLNEKDIQLTFEPVDISRLIEKVIDEMTPIAATHSISFNYQNDFYENVPVDEFYFKRVIKNLILNAISFSNPQQNVDINFFRYEDNLYIKIKNYGSTIKEEDLEHIFDKYYSTSNKFRKVGTGLGLYLSNKIISAHKGELIAESDYNENSNTMIIKLPV